MSLEISWRRLWSPQDQRDRAGRFQRQNQPSRKARMPDCSPGLAPKRPPKSSSA